MVYYIIKILMSEMWESRNTAHHKLTGKQQQHLKESPLALGVGLVVSMLPIYSDNPSMSPLKSTFFCKILFQRKKKYKGRARDWLFLKNHLCVGKNFGVILNLESEGGNPFLLKCWSRFLSIEKILYWIDANISPHSKEWRRKWKLATGMKRKKFNL